MSKLVGAPQSARYKAHLLVDAVVTEQHISRFRVHSPATIAASALMLGLKYAINDRDLYAT